MKKDGMLTAHKHISGNNVDDMVFDFLDLSQKILTIIKHENAILQECGCPSLESYLKHKTTLLKNYEETAKVLIEHSLTALEEDATRDLLIAELSEVKAAIIDNTTYQFKNLGSKTSLKKGAQSWH